jgi:hypothetical protein
MRRNGVDIVVVGDESSPIDGDVINNNVRTIP